MVCFGMLCLSLIRLDIRRINKFVPSNSGWLLRDRSCRMRRSVIVYCNCWRQALNRSIAVLTANLIRYAGGFCIALIMHVLLSVYIAIAFFVWLLSWLTNKLHCRFCMVCDGPSLIYLLSSFFFNVRIIQCGVACKCMLYWTWLSGEYDAVEIK